MLDTCRQLEREGFEVTYTAPQSNGIISLQDLEAALRDDTILVSIMHVNNEIGVVQDIEAIGEMCRARGIIYHVDATQSVGKLPIDLSKLKVDLMSFSGHKIYGPKGIGALYVRRKPRIRIEAQVHGGGHERGMRSGTLPVHQIVGMGEAYRIAKEEMTEEMARLRTLRDRLWNGVKDMEEVYLNGDLEHGAPNILNVSFNYVEGESLIMALKDLAVSSGSACTSASLEPSYVLRALGMSDELAHSSIRFSPRGVSPRKKRSTTPFNWCVNPSAVCAICPRCGRCSSRAWTSTASNGRIINSQVSGARSWLTAKK